MGGWVDMAKLYLKFLVDFYNGSIPEGKLKKIYKRLFK